jgi:hypothetical protein
VQRGFVQRVSSRSRRIEVVGRRQANEDSTSLKDGMGMGTSGFMVAGWDVDSDDDIICFRYITLLPFDLDPRSVGSNRSAISSKRKRALSS